MKNLRHLRELHNLTLEELGAKVGVSIQFISYLEKGFKKPSGELLIRLAKVLDTTAENLME